MKTTELHPIVSLAFVAAFIGAAATARADDIRLRAAVRLPARATQVTLGDVAELQGPLAEQYARLVLGEASGADTLEISVHDVRRALSDAGAHWGRLHLSGSRVLVRPLRSDHAAPPLAMSAASLSEDEDRVPRTPREAPGAPESVSATALLEEPTLRGHVARFLVAALGVAAPNLRIAFRPEDGDALSTSGLDGRFEIVPYGRIDNEVVQLAVRAWRDERIAAQWTLRVRPTLRIEALVTQHDLRRGQAVGDDDVRADTRWLAPSAAKTAARRSDLAKAVLATRVPSGQLLSRDHLEAPLLVRRGDLVMIRCLVGGLAISLKAEAREDAGEGDTILFRKPRERDTFLATVTGAGEAVVDLGGP